MLKPRKRLTRKEIKQDKFITAIGNLVKIIQRNPKTFLISTIVVLVVALTLLGVRQHKRHKEVSATEALGRAEMSRWAGETEQAVKLYREVTQRFADTKSAGEALVALGNLYFDKGETEKAMAAFEKYLRRYKDDSILTYTAWSGIAACLKQEKKYSEAAQKYKEFADRHQESPWAPQALWEAAQCFRLADNPQQAKMTLQQLIDFYPDSPFSYRARSEVKMLGTNLAQK